MYNTLDNARRMVLLVFDHGRHASERVGGWDKFFFKAAIGTIWGGSKSAVSYSGRATYSYPWRPSRRGILLATLKNNKNKQLVLVPPDIIDLHKISNLPVEEANRVLFPAANKKTNRHLSEHQYRRSAPVR